MRNNRQKRILTWMMRKDIKGVSIAEEAGVSKSMVSQFIKGTTKSRPIEEFFIKKGCPIRYLRMRVTT